MYKEKRFYGVAFAYMLGVFNDNAFKTAVIFTVIDLLVGRKYPGDPDGADAEMYGLLLNSEISLYFFLPFVVFATVAGWACDRFSRSKILVVTKFSEVIIMSAGAYAIYLFHFQGANIHRLLIVAVALMALQSTFFSPARNGIIPQLFTEKESSDANGMIEMLQFMGVIFGTAASGLAFVSPYFLLMFPVIALLGALVSLFIPTTSAQNDKLKFNWNIPADLFSGLKLVNKNKSLRMCILGNSYFYALGVVLITCVLNMGKFDFALSKQHTAYLLVVLSVGMGLGCFLAGKLSRGRIELGLVPIGMTGIMIFMLDLSFAGNPRRAGIDLALLGIFAGMFVLPLKVYIQQRSDEASRGRILAMENFISFSFMLGASALVYYGTQKGLFSSTAGVLQVCVALTGVAMLISFYLLPEFVLRFIVVCLTRTIYRMEVRGELNVPEKGPVLLLPNHVTWVDGMLITAATSRQVKFMIGEEYYNKPLLKPFFNWLGYIPVPEGKGRKALVACLSAAKKSLEAGDVLCIFPEGQLTRSGVMSEFKTGFTRMLPKREDLTIVPMYIGMAWGSVLSFRFGQKLKFRMPSHIPYPLSISFGEALNRDVSAEDARRAVRQLEMETESRAYDDERPLHSEFLRYARRHPFSSVMQDSTGTEVSNISLLSRSLALRNFIEMNAEKEEGYIGIILPSCVAGSISALAVMYADKIPVFLNFTASEEALAHAIKKCNMKRILSSKKFMSKVKMNLPEGVEVIFLEDLARSMPASCKRNAFLSILMPAFMTSRKLFPKSAKDINSVATVLFSSGSTGTPKGVVLTHHNFTSNLSGLMRVCAVDKKDSLLGSMPMFHCFGFLSAFWLPISQHNKVVYHPNPLESTKIGDIVKEHQLSIMFGTPTFLGNYARKCTAEQMKSLRIVLSGAEKLRQNVADAFFKMSGVYPLEAYGATELSPAVSVNIPQHVWKLGKTQGKKGSVGHPIPGVLTKVINPESGEALNYGDEGLLLIKGPNVMQGYLDEKEKTAEVLQDGWYNTGDLGWVDKDGYITLTGRLSRFSKIAGEMVPHGAVEEAIHEALETEDLKVVIIGRPDAKKGEKLLALHVDLTKEPSELISIMKGKGIPNLWLPKAADFHQLDEIPLLGSGKLDLKKINEWSPQA